MARPPRRRSPDERLAQLCEVKLDPESTSAREELARALADRNWLVVSEAAKLVGERSLEGYTDLLLGVWQRFLQDGAKTDPGCRAKEAALTALDRLELLDPSPFLAAIRYRQFEPVAAGRTETGGSVRLRALFGLYRTFHRDAALYAGELLADPNPQVRAGVARGIGEYRDPGSVGLLVHKLRTGDDDPVVVAECAGSLLALAGEFALPLLTSMLAEEEEVRREVAALALGQSSRAEAVAVLLEWVENANGRDFAIGVRALGLSRLEPARAFLLQTVSDGSLPRARAALEALGVHAYDPDLWARVEQAAANNRRADLSPALDACARRRS